MSAVKPRRGSLERRSVAELLPHPQGGEVPSLSELDYQTLRADVAARGLLAPIEVTAEGLVLDGRARILLAAERAMWYSRARA